MILWKPPSQGRNNSEIGRLGASHHEEEPPLTFSIRIAAMTAICALPAGAALAQTQESEAGSMSERSADQITCADIVTMDSELIPGALYFVSGYQEGSQAGTGGAGMSGGVADTATGGSTATTGDQGGMSSNSTSEAASASGSGSDGGEGATTATGDSTDATTSTGAAMPDSAGGTSADEPSGTTSATGAGMSTGAAAEGDAGLTGGSTTATTAATASGGDMTGQTSGGTSQPGQPQVVRVTGLFEIPIADVVTLCGESPEMSVSDAVEQHRNGSGTGSSTN